MQRTIVYTRYLAEKLKVIDTLIQVAPIYSLRTLQYIAEDEETFAVAPLIDHLGIGDCDCACIYYGAYLLGRFHIKSYSIACLHWGQLHMVLGVPSWGLVIDPSYIVFGNVAKTRSPIVRRL